MVNAPAEKKKLPSWWHEGTTIYQVRPFEPDAPLAAAKGPPRSIYTDA